MPEANFSLLDLRDLSKPACKLIDAVSGAVGILYEPTRIRRRAKAEADATLIAAKAGVTVDDIQLRAKARVKNKERRRQQNIESVVSQAVTFLPESVSAERVDDDWVFQFFEHSQDVSDEQMKSLWARLLAGEVAKPGSYSLRTLNVVKHLHSEDADLFSKVCKYLWSSGPDKPKLLLFIGHSALGKSDNPTSELNLGALKHLESIGLVHANVNIGLEEPRQLFYFGKGYSFKLIEKKRIIDLTGLVGIGDAALTDVGMELAPLTGAEPDSSYRDAVIEGYRRQQELLIEEIA